MAASKKGPKNKKASQKFKKYKIKEGKVERSRYCPRCGEGTFMAAHANRDYCGLCHYTEFKSK